MTLILHVLTSVSYPGGKALFFQWVNLLFMLGDINIPLNPDMISWTLWVFYTMGWRAMKRVWQSLRVFNLNYHEKPGLLQHSRERESCAWSRQDSHSVVSGLLYSVMYL
jgi:hypothetical protein